MKKILYSGKMKCIKGDLLVYLPGGQSVITLREKKKLEKLWDDLISKRCVNMKTEIESYEIMNHLFGAKTWPKQTQGKRSDFEIQNILGSQRWYAFVLGTNNYLFKAGLWQKYPVVMDWDRSIKKYGIDKTEEKVYFSSRKELEKCLDEYLGENVVGAPLWVGIQQKMKFKENTMSNENLQAQLRQAKIDESKIHQEVVDLEKQIKAEDEPKLGDVVTYSGDMMMKRIILRDKMGKLRPFRKTWEESPRLIDTGSPLSAYEKTGENIVDLTCIDN